MELVKGTVFSTFQEFNTVFEKYCKETGNIFVKRCGRLIALHNKTVKTERGLYPLEWKYLSITFQCKHYGSYTTHSTGIRKNQSSFKTGCQAKLRLCASKTKGGLSLTEMYMQHSGHPEVGFWKKKLKTFEDRMRTVCQNFPRTPSGDPDFEAGLPRVDWQYYRHLLVMSDQLLASKDDPILASKDDPILASKDDQILAPNDDQIMASNDDQNNNSQSTEPTDSPVAQQNNQTQLLEDVTDYKFEILEHDYDYESTPNDNNDNCDYGEDRKDIIPLIEQVSCDNIDGSNDNGVGGNNITASHLHSIRTLQSIQPLPSTQQHVQSKQPLPSKQHLPSKQPLPSTQQPLPSIKQSLSESERGIFEKYNCGNGTIPENLEVINRIDNTSVAQSSMPSSSISSTTSTISSSVSSSISASTTAISPAERVRSATKRPYSALVDETTSPVTNDTLNRDLNRRESDEIESERSVCVENRDDRRNREDSLNNLSTDNSDSNVCFAEPECRQGASSRTKHMWDAFAEDIGNDLKFVTCPLLQIETKAKIRRIVEQAVHDQLTRPSQTNNRLNARTNM